MDMQFGQGGVFQILQQFHRIHWGADLQTMTHAEYMAMTAIRSFQDAEPDRPGVYVSVLADQLMISVSMVSKMLRVLEEHGWILRTIDPESRRNTFVSITDQGRALHDEERARIQATTRLVAEKMGQANVDRLLGEAKKLADCYAEVLGSG